MIKYIIAVAVTTVLEKIAKLNQQNLNGKSLDIRKNPHVINVGLGLNFQHNY